MQCPRCKCELAAFGSIEFEGELFVVYQCDECVEMWQFGETQFEAALSFAVDRAGRLFDGRNFEPLNLN